MQLEQQASTVGWDGSVPAAFDGRLVVLIVAISALAASMNIPYGGVVAAVAAFGVLAGGGIVGHVVGERRLRRLADELTERWARRGGRIDDVTRSSRGLRTEWIVHTERGPIKIGGLALAPVSKLTVDWEGTGDTVDATDAEQRLDRLADEWYAEVFDR